MLTICDVDGGNPGPKIDVDEQIPIEIKSHNFNFRELAAATKNFRQECLLGQGGFGRVYRGTLQGTDKVENHPSLRHGIESFFVIGIDPFESGYCRLWLSNKLIKMGCSMEARSS